MMMNNIEVKELLGVLEKIRVESYPDIPNDLIAQIVQAQFENQDNRVQAQYQTKRLIDAFLSTVFINNKED